MARLAGSARWGASILKQQELYREFRALGRRLAEIDARFKSGCLIGNAKGKRVADPSSAESRGVGRHQQFVGRDVDEVQCLDDRFHETGLRGTGSLLVDSSFAIG